MTYSSIRCQTDSRSDERLAAMAMLLPYRVKFIFHQSDFICMNWER